MKISAEKRPYHHDHTEQHHQASEYTVQSPVNLICYAAAQFSGQRGEQSPPEASPQKYPKYELYTLRGSEFPNAERRESNKERQYRRGICDCGSERGAEIDGQWCGTRVRDRRLIFFLENEYVQSHYENSACNAYYGLIPKQQVGNRGPSEHANTGVQQIGGGRTETGHEPGQKPV